MRITLDLCDELNEELDHKITIFSFPMRYIPLSDLKRGYVGKNWNMKYLRALQRMLIPTQGKGVSARSFFYAAFGKDDKEFVKFLAMPEVHLGWRGHFVEKKKGETQLEVEQRRKIWKENQSYIKEWDKLFNSLGDSKEEFISAIGDNNNSYERFHSLSNELHKKLFIHYFTIPGVLKALKDATPEDRDFIFNYIYSEFPIMYKRIIEYVCNMKTTYSVLEGICNVAGEQFFKDVINNVDFEIENMEHIINCLNRIQTKTNMKVFNFDLVKYAALFNSAHLLNDVERKELLKSIREFDERSVKQLLLLKIKSLKSFLDADAQTQVGNSYLSEEIENCLRELNQQLSLFGE